MLIGNDLGQGTYNICLGEEVDLPPITDEGLVPPSLAELAKGKETGEVPVLKEKDETATMVTVAEGIQPLPKKVRRVDVGICRYQFPQEDLTLPSAPTGILLVQSLDSLRRRKKKVTDFHSWVHC